jgi:YVTN family beta-propeller protein
MKHRARRFVLLSFVAAAAPVRAQSFAYVANQLTHNISIIDTRTNTLRDTIPLTSSEYSPAGIAVSPDGSRLFVANSNSHTVTMLNVATRAFVATNPAGQHPVSLAVSPDGRRLYVANAGSASISVLNAQNLGLQAKIRVGFTPVSLAVAPDSGRVYVANASGNSVSVVDPALIGSGDDPVIATVPVGAAPIAVVVAPGGTTAYAANSGSASISQIDLAANRVAATLKLERVPAGLAVSADGTRLYVPGFGPSITAIDTASHEMQVFGLPACPVVRCAALAAAVSGDGKVLYAANTAADDVVAIDTRTGRITARIQVGWGPRALVLSPIQAEVR